MHRALQIAELVDIICCHLAPKKASLYARSAFLSSDLVALATTSHIFLRRTVEAPNDFCPHFAMHAGGFVESSNGLRNSELRSEPSIQY